MQTFLLDLFASIALMCAMGVIGSANPLHSVIFLILVFCDAAGFLLALTPKAEFIAIMFLIIYVGAIAVLFLFVVMMIGTAGGASNWFPRLLVVSTIILCFSVIPYSSSATTTFIPFSSMLSAAPSTNIYALPITYGIQALGNLIYTYYFYFFLLSAAILLVAMIGAIVLTLHRRKNASKWQAASEQVTRHFENAIHWAS